MKLTKAHIHDFRCIEDSEQFSIGSVTCLVGKNESGKTSVLHALEKLNPIDDSRKKLDKYRDYPRFKLSEYDPSAPLSKTTWKIEHDDIAAVEAKLGKGALKTLDIDITLKHDGKQSWGLVHRQRSKRHTICFC